jgi:O-antigen/teichoic acid export membrane protein
MANMMADYILEMKRNKINWLKKPIYIINRVKDNIFIMQSVNTIILRVIGIITLFGFTLFLTHNYSPAIVGQYDFIRTFLLVVGSLCLLGTEQSILYFAGIIKSQGNKGELKKIYLKKVSMVFFTSMIPVLIVFLIGEKIINSFFNDNFIYLLLIKATGILLFYCITILNTETFRALDKIYMAELFRNTFKYLSVIIGAVYLFYSHQEQYLVDSYLLGFIILSIISFFMILSFFNKLEIENQLQSVIISHKEIIVKSYPMAISGMAFFLLMSFDIMFLKKYYGNEQVAYYSTAIKLMTILSMVIISVNITASTKIAKFYASNNMTELNKTLKNTSRLIFLITFPIAFITSIYSNSILKIFGVGYINASLPLIILMFGQAFCSLFGSATIYLNMTGRQKIFQYILIIAVVINFVSNRLLVPKYGMIGASISFVLSLLFWNISTAVIVYRKDGVNILLS